MNNEKIFAMPFVRIYQALTAKAERKNRTREEVDELICWLTGYTPEEIRRAGEDGTAYGDFFRNAPAMNPKRKRITGAICGVRLAEIEDPLMQDIRYLDKLVDELAKGKPLEKILPND